MKQYYIQEINLNNINLNKINFPYKKYTQKMILTNYGYFLFKNNNMIKKKIILKDSYSIDNFIDNYTLLFNDVNHVTFKFPKVFSTISELTKSLSVTNNGFFIFNVLQAKLISLILFSPTHIVVG